MAILIYNPKDFSQASYYPMAAFSPEWVAMRYAARVGIPVYFMDLPADISFGMRDEAQQQLSLELESDQTDAPAYRKDPFGYLAQLAGYSDHERWWEVTFEQSEGHSDTFELVQELMTELREGSPIRPEDLLREAFMRKTLRKYEKQHDNLAVICGAWHGPVISDLKAHSIKTDNTLLKGRKKIRTKATWVPWTYARIWRGSGYGAGVVAPAWYELLYHKREQVVVEWMTRVAQLLRSKRLVASSAHVIEAVRLAETLAAMRGRSLPGLAELQEAATAVIAEGRQVELDLIQEQLVVGEAVGSIPDDIPVVPLQADLERTIKSCRLTKDWAASKLGKVDKELDVRKDTQRNASYLLRRLQLLGIPWGTQQRVQKSQHRASGSFAELWQLHWLPDYAILIIEAGMWGNTVDAAALRRASVRADEARTLPELTQLLFDVLNAELPALLPRITRLLSDMAALTRDIDQLVDALPMLVQALRYGSTRQLDLTAVEAVLTEMVPRICIGFPMVCRNIADDLAETMHSRLRGTHHYLHLLRRDDYTTQWADTLSQLTDDESVHALLRGAATRLLHERGVRSPERTATAMSYALSVGTPPDTAARWVEGFLHGSGMLLLHQPQLWLTLDGWVDQLPMPTFEELLPLLRRTFASFSAGERREMLALARRGVVARDTATYAIDEARAAHMRESLAVLLG